MDNAILSFDTMRTPPFQRASFGLVLFTVVALLPTPIWACALCLGFPEKTASDHLLESHCVLLARNSLDNAFVYTPASVLKGAYDSSDIGLLVDSRTRRVLSNDPNRHVLLVQKTRGGPWQNLGIVNETYLAVVRRILALETRWTDRFGERDRWQFFLQLFDHSDPSIRQLAYLEIGRAPYSVIKQLGKRVPRDSYEFYLRDPKYLKWRSLAILLLAQSEKASDRQYIRDSFRSAHRFGLTSNLAALTAAAVEVDGNSAIDFVEQNYFRKNGKSLEEVRAVSNALSILGKQTKPVLQDQIVSAYRHLIHHYPVVAADIADDLQKWERFELADKMSLILEEQDSLKFEARQPIRQYIRAATASEAKYE